MNETKKTKELLYTNEFLKNLEKVIKEENIQLLEQIKKTLDNILSQNSEGEKLENIKTDDNQDIFQEQIEYKTEKNRKGEKNKYSLFWTKKEEKNGGKTEENGQKIVICLTKNT